ncbi:pentatricopeptide repeat-containing protein PET309 [Entomortierella parvispora]|uniref:Pentatricopeptide repeat-containing protein PET309 n=1 Tax=Entomortierella parvispora TaxID=205924 RepID=A0A9P3H4N7_9FUNG|nr:pentatricopeptide repeat-containing protein PET309 [Entomortierella parvispora]
MLGSQSFLAADNIQRGKRSYPRGYAGPKDSTAPSGKQHAPFDTMDRSRVISITRGSARTRTLHQQPRKYLHTTRSSRVFTSPKGGLGQRVSISDMELLIAELRQKTLVKGSISQLYAIYTRITNAGALSHLQSDDVNALFQHMSRSLQSEEAMEFMLQIAADVNSTGKQLPQLSYEILLNQAIDHMPTDQIKTTFWQIQGRRRFITELLQLCDSNVEMKRLLGLYRTLITATYDLDGFSTYYQERKGQTVELARLILQWVQTEGTRVNSKVVEGLFVFLLDRSVLDEVFAAMVRLSKEEGVQFGHIFYTTAIHRFGRAKKFDYMDMTLDLMRRQGLKPLEDTYSAIIDAHSKAGNLREAQRAYQDILAAGLVPTEKTFGPMVEAVGKMGDFEMTKQLVDHMNASGVASNKYTFNALLQSLSENPDRSAELFQEMSKQVQPSTVNYNMLIRSYQQHGDLDGAYNVFRTMIANNVRPDRYTFSSILNLFATRGDADGAEVFWNEMVNVHHVTPNAYAYGSMVHAYCTAEDMIGAQSVYRQMIKAGIMPNQVVFGTLLSAYARSGDLTQMLSIYDAMRAEGLLPNSYIYSNLLYGLVNDGDMAAAKRLFENMEEDGFGDNVLAQTILMKGYLDQGRVKESQEVYMNMVNSGLIPNFETYAVMLHSHVRRGDKKKGRALLNQIMKFQEFAVKENDASSKPDPVDVEDSVLHRAHVGHLSTMGTERKPLKAGSRPNALYAFVPLLDSYAKEGNIMAAKAMFQEIRDRGLEPNTITYTTLMDGYRRAGDVDSVLNIWTELFERHLAQWKEAKKELGSKTLPTKNAMEWVQDRVSTRASKLRQLMQHPISITMDALGYSGQIAKVQSIWKGLEDIGFEFDSANWNDYVIALARNGHIIEACTIFQEKLLPGLKSTQEEESSNNDFSSFKRSPTLHRRQLGPVQGDLERFSDSDNMSTTARVYDSPKSLLYPRPRTMAALADSLEDLLKFKGLELDLQKVDGDLTDPHYDGGAEDPQADSKRAEKRARRRIEVEKLLMPYPRPFENLEEQHRKFIWTTIRFQFPRVLEALKDGMLVAAESVTHLNKHGSTLPIWSASVSAVSDEDATPAVTPASTSSSSSSSKTTPMTTSDTTTTVVSSNAATPEFTGFRPWRNLKAVMKDMERRQFMEERSVTIREREERFDLLRNRKPKPYN